MFINYKTSKELDLELQNSVQKDGGFLKWSPLLAHDFMNSNGNVNTESFGYRYTIQTVTQIRNRVIEQKFYTVNVGDYVTVVPGTGAYMEDIKTNLVYDVASPFETGIMTNSSTGNLDTITTATAPITTKIFSWAKATRWSIFEVAKALAANNFDIIEKQYAALKRNYDLGIQKTAFFGQPNVIGCTGLLNNAEVNSNLSVITTNISGLSSANFQTLVKDILASYRSNVNYTAMPNTFVMPESDYLGMGTATSADFTIVTKMKYLLDTFKELTGNQDFKILPAVYSQQAQNAGILSVGGKNRYMLYNRNEDSQIMDMPLPFTMLGAGTADNFHFQTVSYAQFAGVTFFRVPEMLYFDWNT